MDKDSQKMQLIVEYCNTKNKFIDKKSITALEQEEDWKSIIGQVSEPMISFEIINNILLKKDSKLGNVKEEIIIKKKSFNASAKEMEANFRIMDELDVTNNSCSEGTLKNFLNYFNDKYSFLNSLIAKRIGFNPKTFDKLKGLSKYEEVDLIGMVNKKWVSKKGNITLELDSPEGRCIAIVSKDDAELTRESNKVLIDDVIGLKVKKFVEEVVIIQSFLWPDLMLKTPKKIEKDVSIMLLSDLHTGSKLFMEKDFGKFLSWINGNTTSEKEAERLGKIKYIIVAGDNVDGIGIYPDQINELAIKDIYKQYDKFTELIKQIPEYIEVFICPGQHDAVRRADPQPAIPKEYVKELSELNNFHFIGSPGWVDIEGFKSLVYHGASHHDMYAAMHSLDPKKPEQAMIELLRRRDISTGFGLKQPYVPEKKDFMIIREEPDFYFAGDMHHKGYAQYRGCTCMNSGCWQLRTDFQIKEGHTPTPGITLDINLKTKKITENIFYKGD